MLGLLRASKLFVCFFICSNTVLYAQGKQIKRSNQPSITAVILRDMNPDSYVDTRNNKTTGFCVEVLNTVAAKAGFKKINYLIVDDWEEIEDALRTGKADLCPVMAISEKRKKEFIFSTTIETFAISIAVRSQNTDIYDTTTLKGKIVGVLRESQAYQILKNYNNISLANYESFQVAIMDLLAGHIDAFVAPEHIIRNISVEAGIDKSIRINKVPLKEFKRAIAFPKKATSIYVKMVPYIHSFVTTPEYKMLYSKWFLPPTPYWTVKRVLIWGGIFIFSLLLFFAILYNRSILSINRQLSLTLEEKEKARQQLEESLIQIREINTELEISKNKAEESDKLKTAFLQNMSHEIRTPMNAIIGFSDLLSTSFDNKEKLESFANIINQRSNDLLEIINEILEISRIEAGIVSLKYEECSLNSLLEDLHKFFNEYRKRINKHDITINVSSVCDPYKTVIVTDIIKLKQIFINLINNALKFTEKGSIEIGCNKDGDDKVCFYVKDTGIGIPPDKKLFIFERFSQLKPAVIKSYSGVGLGLSIVKELISQIGGTIWLESEEGKGSTFYFIIPSTHAIKLNGNTPNVLDIPLSININKSILIVEDDSYNIALLTEIMNEFNMPYYVAKNGAEALAITSNNKIDVVLMDIRLPDYDGTELTRIIKNKNPKVWVIAQTAYALAEDKKKIFEAGCDDYISKPLKRKELITKINNYYITVKENI